MTKDKREHVFNEEDKCVKLLAVWLIRRNGELMGRITSRPSSAGGTSYVTVHFYHWMNAGPLYGYEKMTGWGYNRTDAGIGSIFWENRERLKGEYGIELPDSVGDIENRWQKSLETAGYNVIQAI